MELVVRIDPQLRRLERSIAELEAQPPNERARKAWLLSALHNERAELLKTRRKPSPAL